MSILFDLYFERHNKRLNLATLWKFTHVKPHP